MKKDRKKETKSKKREKAIPDHKIKTVSKIADKIKSNRTTLIVSTKGLPSSNFHQIKKNLRDKAEINVAKKSLILRAIDKSGKQGINNLKESIGADIAVFFSNLDAFELSASLADNQSPASAKTGDIAPEDINIEPGPTTLVPGPAISELSSVGLKVAVEGGKLSIKQPATIVYAGDEIKPNVASVLLKLDIMPMKVGFEPLAAYDSQEDKVYIGIKIDKKKAYEELKESISKALGFAVNLMYMCEKTISYYIAKAGIEEKALLTIIDRNTNEPKSDVKDETPKEDNVQNTETKEDK